MFALTRSGAAMLLSASTAALVLAASPALAAEDNWYSRSSPLAAVQDGANQALAYGTAYTKASYLKNHTFYRDPRAGGDRVYTETAYRYYEYCSSYIGVAWCGEQGKDQSARDSSGDWVDQYDGDDYSGRNPDKGRVSYKVCEDHANAFDVCSREPFSTFAL